jgi:Condensation domain
MEVVEPRAGYHAVVDAHKFTGDVDAETVADALAAVYARHPILRARFIERDGDLYKLPSELPPCVNVTTAEGSSSEARVNHLARGASPMLESELCRATVVVLDPDALVLVQRFHHSVMDGWSLGTLLDELETVYAAMREGASWHLPTPEASYDDYVSWEEEWLDSPAGAAEADYWRTALSGSDGRLRLHRARAPHRGSHAGGVVQRSLPAELAEELRGCAREHQLTPFGAVLACYALALARCADQWDITIGTSVAARPDRRFDRVVGCFANRVPIRVKVTPDQSTADLLAGVRTATREAFSHQLLPLDAIGRAAGSPHPGDPNALFTAFLSMDAFSERSPVLAGAVSEDVEPYDTDTSFETALWIGERPDGSLRLDFRYSTDLYERDVHERLADVFATTAAELPRAVETVNR